MLIILFSVHFYIIGIFHKKKLLEEKTVQINGNSKPFPCSDMPLFPTPPPGICCLSFNERWLLTGTATTAVDSLVWQHIKGKEGKWEKERTEKGKERRCWKTWEGQITGSSPEPTCLWNLVQPLTTWVALGIAAFSLLRAMNKSAHFQEVLAAFNGLTQTKRPLNPIGA